MTPNIVRLYRRSWLARYRQDHHYCCRFIPSCSEYCLLAHRKYGFWVGTAKTIWRLLRCNPWNHGSCVDYP